MAGFDPLGQSNVNQILFILTVYTRTVAEAIWAVLVESRECSLHDYMQFNGQ